MPVPRGRSRHLRLQSDERLIALVRRGQHAAFETLVKRYHPRLLAFCRHMLHSAEDAEDVLQEVFASAYSALQADDRPIAARPWLYRIARNRCLNHLRRPQDTGQDSMDVFERAEGATTADTVHTREEFKQIVADVQELPETQRTALLLREIDALSYDQIADAMETSVPSVKSLLVRARLSLAEASEARQLSCGEVRLQLTQHAEGMGRPSAPARRHVRGCHRCRSFRRELRRTGTVLAAAFPIGGILAVKKSVLAKVGAGAATAGEGLSLVGGSAAGLLSAGSASVVTKAAAGLAAAAIVTAGASDIGRGAGDRPGDGGGGPAQTSAPASTDDEGENREVADTKPRRERPAGGGGVLERRDGAAADGSAAERGADQQRNPEGDLEPAAQTEQPVEEEDKRTEPRQHGARPPDEEADGEEETDDSETASGGGLGSLLLEPDGGAEHENGRQTTGESAPAEGSGGDGGQRPARGDHR